MADTYEDFRRDDAAYERDLYHREELEREDIMSMALDPAQTVYPQPVVAVMESMTEDWEAA